MNIVFKKLLFFFQKVLIQESLIKVYKIVRIVFFIVNIAFIYCVQNVSAIVDLTFATEMKEEDIPAMSAVLTAKLVSIIPIQVFSKYPNFGRQQAKGDSSLFSRALYRMVHRNLCYIHKKSQPLKGLPKEHPHKKKLVETLCALTFTPCYPGEDPRFLFSESDEDESCYNPEKPESRDRLFLVPDPSFAGRGLIIVKEEQSKDAPKEPSVSRDERRGGGTQSRLRIKFERKRKEQQRQQLEELCAVGGVEAAPPPSPQFGLI